MAVKSYDPAQVTVVFGATIVGGYAPDAAISVEHDEDDWSLQIGVGGEDTRSKSNNKSATVTLSLMQSSASNDLLSAQRAADVNTPGGVGGYPLLIVDGSGRTVLSAETAWVQRPPTAEYSRESSTREWVIRTGNLNALHGGN